MPLIPTCTLSDAFLITHPASTDSSHGMKSLRFLKIIRLVLVLITSCVSYTGCVGGFQRFAVTPESLQVREGEDVTLECVVANQQGRAQWTKDGFALGFERDVPGYPRFSYLGDPKQGQHHLLINSVSMTDDGEYQCQVGPTLTNPPIWAAANLTVLLAPTGIGIEGHGNGSTVELAEGDRLSLSCLVSDARPIPSVAWHKAGHQADPAQVESHLLASTLPYRWSIRSRLVWKVEAEDDGEMISCTAVHPALDEGVPLRASLRLSVQHPPDPPEISGYETGEVALAGDRLTLSCRAKGGNPRPSVLWYRNGRLLDDSFARESEGTVNTLQVGVTTAANGDQLECRAKNGLMESPSAAEVTLSVHYPPSLVSLTGSSWVEVGGSLKLQCEATESNPPATLIWLVKGEAVGSPAAVVRKGSGNGWVSRSKFLWQQRGNEDRVMIECRAKHPALREPMRKTTLITVTKPVGAPEFEGDPSKDIVAGTSLDLMCSVRGTQPPPSIRIYKNGRLVPTEAAQGDGKSSAKGVVEVTSADNGSEVKCEVASPASETPKVTSTRLTVLFPPDKVTASAVPKTAEEGTAVKLSCETASSSPEAKINWVSEGEALEGAVSSSSSAAFGGYRTRSELNVRASAADNGRNYVCEASNGLGPTLRDETTINVLHGPVWVEKPSPELVTKEGSQMTIRAKASANPGPVRYWWRKGLEVLVGAGGELRLESLTKDQSGNYTVSAYSRRGAVNASFHLRVLYGPEDIQAPDLVTVDQGDSVNLQCSAKGDPTPHLTWSRKSRTLASGDGTTRLAMDALGGDDTGVYDCRASSPLGTSGPASTRIIVRQPAEVAEGGPGASWAAAGGRGRLACLARAAPPPTFAWSGPEGGPEIVTGGRYTVRRPEAVDDLVLWRSVLEVDDVGGRDYGRYRCSASNALGSGSAFVALEPPAPPAAPSNLTALSVGNGSVVLGWSSGGAKDLGFTVRYRPDGTLLYQYLHVPEGGGSPRAEVGGLSPGTKYNFSVQAEGERGTSDFSLPPITVTTLGPASAVPPAETTYRLTSLLLLVIIVSAMALLVLNAFIIACILKQHSKRRNSSIRSSSTKTTSLATHCNSPTSSPEGHHHHHEHHHQVILPLDQSSPKVGRQANKIGSKGKKVEEKTRFLINGRIPQENLAKSDRKTEADPKRGRLQSSTAPEARSLIPKEKREPQEGNSGDEKPPASDSSAETAIFCSQDAALPSFPPSGGLQKEEETSRHQEEEGESPQEYRKRKREEFRRQLQQETSTRSPQSHSFTRLRDLHNSISHYQRQHYHKAYNPGTSPHGSRHSLPEAHSERNGFRKTRASGSMKPSPKPYLLPPQSPRRTHYKSHQSPDKPSSRPFQQLNQPPDKPQRHYPSPSGAQRSHLPKEPSPKLFLPPQRPLPPPVPPKKGLKQGPPAPQPLQISPRLRRKFSPSARPVSAHFSPKGSPKGQSPRYSAPPTPKAVPGSSEAQDGTFHHEFPYFELVYADSHQQGPPSANYPSLRGQNDHQLPQRNLVPPTQGLRETNSPFINSRRPRFPDDFLWQGSSEKL